VYKSARGHVATSIGIRGGPLKFFFYKKKKKN
jgi:hypothetical protein